MKPAHRIIREGVYPHDPILTYELRAGAKGKGRRLMSMAIPPTPRRVDALMRAMDEAEEACLTRAAELGYTVVTWHYVYARENMLQSTMRPSTTTTRRRDHD